MHQVAERYLLALIVFVLMLVSAEAVAVDFSETPRLSSLQISMTTQSPSCSCTPREISSKLSQHPAGIGVKFGPECPTIGLVEYAFVIATESGRLACLFQGL